MIANQNLNSDPALISSRQEAIINQNLNSDTNHHTIILALVKMWLLIRTWTLTPPSFALVK